MNYKKIKELTNKIEDIEDFIDYIEDAQTITIKPSPKEIRAISQEMPVNEITQEIIYCIKEIFIQKKQ